jgi:hypothetical protein
MRDTLKKLRRWLRERQDRLHAERVQLLLEFWRDPDEFMRQRRFK